MRKLIRIAYFAGVLVVEFITPAQIRGARAMLDWSMIDLSRAAKVSVSTVKRAEDDGVTAVAPVTLGMMQSAFEAEGVRFLRDKGNGVGLTFQPR